MLSVNNIVVIVTRASCCLCAMLSLIYQPYVPAEKLIFTDLLALLGAYAKLKLSTLPLFVCFTHGVNSLRYLNLRKLNANVLIYCTEKLFVSLKGNTVFYLTKKKIFGKNL